MNRKLESKVIPDINRKLLDGITVTEISNEYGYSHPSAFIKGLKSVGYTVSKTLKPV